MRNRRQIFCKWEGYEKVEGGKKEKGKELRCVTLMYQLPVMNVIIYCKLLLIKAKKKKKKKMGLSNFCVLKLQVFLEIQF